MNNVDKVDSQKTLDQTHLTSFGLVNLIRLAKPLYNKQLNHLINRIHK